MTDKDKYFEQATQKTGILSDVVKVLNEKSNPPAMLGRIE